MSSTSKQLADALANHVLRNITFTSPTTVYLAMHVSGGSTAVHPGKDQADAFANEASYASYQRQPITFGAPTGTENAITESSAPVTFPEVDLGQASFDVTGLSIWTSERGGTLGASGTMLLAAPINSVRTMEEGDAPLVASGAITATFGQEL